jgi:hypothetical protein
MSIVLCWRLVSWSCVVSYVGVQYLMLDSSVLCWCQVFNVLCWRLVSWSYAGVLCWCLVSYVGVYSALRLMLVSRVLCLMLVSSILCWFLVSYVGV